MLFDVWHYLLSGRLNVAKGFQSCQYFRHILEISMDINKWAWIRIEIADSTVTAYPVFKVIV